MRIRDATPADLPAIVEIYNSTVPSRMVTADPEPVSIESRRSWFHEHDSQSRPLWVAEVDGEIAGWFSFEPFRKKAAYHVTAEVSVYVSEKHRRKGIGRRFLGEAIYRSPSLGLRTLTGGIFAHNKASIKLFEGFGFEQWGYYPRVAELDGIEQDLVVVGLRLLRSGRTDINEFLCNACPAKETSLCREVSLAGQTTPILPLRSQYEKRTKEYSPCSPLCSG